MYSVSDDYLNKAASNVVHFVLEFTISDLDGTFTEDDVVGAPEIVMQCADDDEITLGSVYIGELDITFKSDLGITRGTWKGREIVIKEGLLIGDSYEYVPLGKFYIADAQHTSEGVKVTAYDAMSKLDKTTVYNDLTGTLYFMAKTLIDAAGATLATTEDEFSAFTNSIYEFKTHPDTDITTYRDYLSWIAQACGCFVTANRNGEIEFRRYSTTPIATVNEFTRFTGCSFSDFTTYYTGMSVVNIDAQTTAYFTATDITDDGLTYNLGSSPILQEYPEVRVQNIIDYFANIKLVPFEAEIMVGAYLDLGDCIAFTGGLAGDGATGGVMYISYTYGEGTLIKGFGSNPSLATASSKTDKNLSGLMTTVKENEIYIRTVTNAKKITAADGGDDETVLIVQYATAAASQIAFHAEIDVDIATDDSSATTSTTNTSESSTENDDGTTTITTTTETTTITELQTGNLTFSWYLNGEKQDLIPVETVTAGERILHLMLLVTANEGANNILQLKVAASGCTAEIPEYNANGYLIGKGLAAQASWDGRITIDEEAEIVSIPFITFDKTSANDSVIISTQIPTAISLTESATAKQIPFISFDKDGVTDELAVNPVRTNWTWTTSDEATYSSTYVTTGDTGYILQTSYTVSGTEEEIDTGYLTSITPLEDTTVQGLESVEDVEIKV